MTEFNHQADPNATDRVQQAPLHGAARRAESSDFSELVLTS